MTQNIGKILFIDDKYEDPVKKAVTLLVEKGLTVQFWNGKGDFPSTISNVRVVIVDLDLADTKQQKTATLSFYYPVLEALNKIPAPVVAIIMAREFDEEDPHNLNHFYEESYGPFKGIILDAGLDKEEEFAEPTKLWKIITESIEKEKILKLLFTWEAIVDKAQDKAFSQLISKDIKCTLPNMMRSICRDFGEESAARELVDTIMQIVSRQTYASDEFKVLDKLVKEINAGNYEVSKEYPCKEDFLLYNKLMFYAPTKDEPYWTGDIFKTEGLEKYYDYAIILTPVCDFANTKSKRLLLCFGFPILEEAFADKDYPPYKHDPAIAKKIDLKKPPEEIIAAMKRRYFGSDKTGESFYPLWNFIEGDKVLGVCFDFTKVQSVDNDKIKWTRIQRLDFPFKQHMLESYGRFMSRVGVSEINKNPEQLRNRLNAQVKEKQE
ncbi:MAG: hypothetical protein M1540_05355 [Candidatus Bathyarchaeota archaeon]|nr:hypothetical protein [Candidatus Bathyarchaeota archaeon]